MVGLLAIASQSPPPVHKHMLHFGAVTRMLSPVQSKVSSNGQLATASLRMPANDQGLCPTLPLARTPNAGPNVGGADGAGNAPISGYRGDVSQLPTQMGHEASTPPVAMVEQSTRDETSAPVYSRPPTYTSTPLTQGAVQGQTEAPRGSPPWTSHLGCMSSLSHSGSRVSMSPGSPPLADKYLEESHFSPSLVTWLESLQSPRTLAWSPTAITQEEFPSVSELGSVASATCLAHLNTWMGVPILEESYVPMASMSGRYSAGQLEKSIGTPPIEVRPPSRESFGGAMAARVGEYIRTYSEVGQVPETYPSENPHQVASLSTSRGSPEIMAAVAAPFITERRTPRYRQPRPAVPPQYLEAHSPPAETDRAPTGSFVGSYQRLPSPNVDDRAIELEQKHRELAALLESAKIQEALATEEVKRSHD